MLRATLAIFLFGLIVCVLGCSRGRIDEDAGTTTPATQTPVGDIGETAAMADTGTQASASEIHKNAGVADTSTRTPASDSVQLWLNRLESTTHKLETTPYVETPIVLTLVGIQNELEKIYRREEVSYESNKLAAELMDRGGVIAAKLDTEGYNLRIDECALMALQATACHACKPHGISEMDESFESLVDDLVVGERHILKELGKARQCGGLRDYDLFRMASQVMICQLCRTDGVQHTRETYEALADDIIAGTLHLRKELSKTDGAYNMTIQNVFRMASQVMICQLFRRDSEPQTRGTYIALVDAALRPRSETTNRDVVITDTFAAAAFHASTTSPSPTEVQAEEHPGAAEPESKIAKPLPRQSPTSLGSPEPEAEPIRQVRTWRDASGKFSVNAEFGGLISDEVTLIKEDGSTIQVPLEKLSVTDREWIEK